MREGLEQVVLGEDKLPFDTFWVGVLIRFKRFVESAIRRCRDATARKGQLGGGRGTGGVIPLGKGMVRRDAEGC